MNKKFKKAILGGTFDHLHKGHKDFIFFAISNSEKLIVGITSDEYIQNSQSKTQNPESIESFEKRKKEFEEFIKNESLEKKIEIIKIDNVYGPAIDIDSNIEAIIVVDKTLHGASEVNVKRKELGLTELEIIIAPSSFAEDGKTISSSRIRKGEIDRDGKLYVNQEWLNNNLYLPQSMRGEFKKPLGTLVDDKILKDIEGFIITVGDVTTEKFNSLYLNQRISVIDLRVKRENKFSNVSELNFLGNEKVFQAENKAGQISSKLFKTIINAFSEKDRVIIKVLGEEDLAVLPMILAAPLGAFIFYGQPNSGLVMVKVSEETKEKVFGLLTEFTKGS